MGDQSGTGGQRSSDWRGQLAFLPCDHCPSSGRGPGGAQCLDQTHTRSASVTAETDGLPAPCSSEGELTDCCPSRPAHPPPPLTTSTGSMIALRLVCTGRMEGRSRLCWTHLRSCLSRPLPSLARAARRRAHTGPAPPRAVEPRPTHQDRQEAQQPSADVAHGRQTARKTSARTGSDCQAHDRLSAGAHATVTGRQTQRATKMGAHISVDA